MAPGRLPDILCPPDYAARELWAMNRLQQLDHASLPNLDYIDPIFRFGRAHDPNGDVSIIKDWGTTGLMYRQDMVYKTPLSWADFWDLAEEYSGRVVVLDSPGEVIGAALKMRGYSYNATHPEALQGARDDLLGLKPNLLAFTTDYRPLLASGEACLALGWNGDAAALRKEGIPVQYVIPEEGSQIWEDDWGIASGAPHLEAAYAFLNFVLRPEIAAQEARYTGYATGNQAAYSLLDETTRLDASVYPPMEVLRKLERGLPLESDGDLRRRRLWAEIRV